MWAWRSYFTITRAGGEAAAQITGARDLEMVEGGRGVLVAAILEVYYYFQKEALYGRVPPAVGIPPDGFAPRG